MKVYPLRQEHIISYDVQDNKIRGNIFKQLEQYGLKPVQKSVFWGYLARPELEAIKRYLKSVLEKNDKAFITRTSFNGKGHCYFIGHEKTDFSDWKETDVI